MATPEEKRLREDINQLVNELKGITQETLENQRSISNALQDSINLLQFEKTERAQIRSITKEVNKIASENLTIFKDELGTSKNIANIQKAQNTLAARRNVLESIQKQLKKDNSKENEVLLSGLQEQLDSIDAINKQLEETKQQSADIASNFGVKIFSSIEDISKSIPGLRVFSKPFEQAAGAARNAAQSSGKFLKQFGAGVAALGGAALTGALALVLKSITDLNQSQTEFRRLTGESAVEVGLLNDGLLTSVDLIKTQVALTEQFGLNARAAFGTETLQEVGELTKAVGLSAEEAGNFARFSEITGYNLNGQLDALSKSVPKAFSQKQILSETANVSSDIALAFGNSAYEIGQSVIAAKQLGLTLKDVNGIADTLLDIEESLTAEFEAEVITGRQLNFERARGFALQNDIAGLTNEIKNNEEFILSFANANRIEQEAIAATLGMNRQQMADMVMQSQLFNTLTEEQRMNAAGVGLEQLKQLTIQQSIETSINKITQSLAGPLELFASMVQYATQFTSLIAGAVGGLVAFKGINTAIIAQEKIKLALANTKSLREAALVAIRSIGNPLALAGGLAAGVAAYAAAKSYITKGDDVISPGYGKRTLLSPEGAIALNNKDTVIAGTDLGRGGRNTGELVLTDAQINRIANAVREGASRATINLDGDRVSNRIQPSLAVNTRKYSV